MRTPEQLERRWVRHGESGQLGSIIEEDGKLFVELDRFSASKAHNRIPYRPKEWMHEEPPPLLTEQMVAHIQFVADVELCRNLGLFKLASRQWESLKDEQRIQWVKEGPDPERHPARARLYQAIKIATEGLTNAAL